MLKSVADTEERECPWSELSPETICSPWSVLPLTVKSQEATFVMIWMTTESQLRNRDIEHFSDKPYPHLHLPKEQPKQKVIKETS